VSKEKSERNMEIYRRATLKRHSIGDLAIEFDLTDPRIYQIITCIGKKRYGKHLTLEQLRRRERAKTAGRGTTAAMRADA